MFGTYCENISAIRLTVPQQLGGQLFGRSENI